MIMCAIGVTIVLVLWLVAIVIFFAIIGQECSQEK